MVEGSLESLHAKTVNIQYLCKYQINIKTYYIKYLLDKSPWAPTQVHALKQIKTHIYSSYIF